jgi:LPXTG-motif cell wall-anchored protein
MIVRLKQLLSSMTVVVFLALALVMGTTASVLADTYNCGVYGAGTYQNNVCGASTDMGGGGGLVDTGQSIWLILLAVLLILAGTIMLYRTRKKMKARLAQNSS